MPCKPLYRLTHTLYSHNFALEGAIFALEAPYLLFALLLMQQGLHFHLSPQHSLHIGELFSSCAGTSINATSYVAVATATAIVTITIIVITSHLSQPYQHLRILTSINADTPTSLLLWFSTFFTCPHSTSLFLLLSIFFAHSYSFRNLASSPTSLKNLSEPKNSRFV